MIRTITPDAGFEDILSQRPFIAPAACPCTAEALCTAPDLAPFFDAQCNVPRHGSRTYSMHGGAGKLPLLQVMHESQPQMHETQPQMHEIQLRMHETQPSDA